LLKTETPHIQLLNSSIALKEKELLIKFQEKNLGDPLNETWHLMEELEL